ncbi:MAG: hypothetical protein K8T25_05045 [Planctomycetia bacterium]|nr:hypothetical protein [Planctomycetia bacterium]
MLRSRTLIIVVAGLSWTLIYDSRLAEAQTTSAHSGGEASPPKDPIAAPPPTNSTPGANANETPPQIPNYFGGQSATAPGPAWPDPTGTKPQTDPAAAAPVGPADDNQNADFVRNLYQRANDSTWYNATGFLLLGLTIAIWVLGFGLLQIGFVRSPLAAKILGQSLLIIPIGCLAFWAYGFALGWGNFYNSAVPPGWYSTLGPGTSVLQEGIGIGTQFDAAGKASGSYRWGLLGTKGFFLHGVDDLGVMTLFAGMATFLIKLAVIPIGAMADRWSWKTFWGYGLWVALPFSLFANWVWGGGWLTQVGANWHLGHGAVDFAGSGLVFGLAGVTTLGGSLALGRRFGVCEGAEPGSFPVWNSRALAAGFLIWAGVEIVFVWVAADSGNTDLPTRAIKFNSMYSIVAGGAIATILPLLRSSRPTFRATCQGMLAGWVAIAAPIAFVESWGAATIGAVAGGLAAVTIAAVRKLQINDPMGVISVCGVCGLWGVLAVGIFATGKYGAGWSGVDRFAALQGDVIQQQQWQQTTGVAFDGVRGLLYGDPGQFAAQLIYCATLGVVGLGLAYAFFWISSRLFPK